MTIAPLVIFTYNRPQHTARLLRSLAANPEYQHSPITIYCDAPKKSEHTQSVHETRNVVRELAPAHAQIVERDENYGLAKSIITGVSEAVKEHGRVIVAEDDLEFTSGALGFMNEALDRYADDSKVTHISAYMYPVSDAVPEAFFYREASCWGWATWDRAWQHFEQDAEKLIDEIDQRNLRFDFDVEGSMYFYTMLEKQRDGDIDSWAIRWYASNLLRGGLSLHPARSYVENNGFDGSGIHCNVDERFVVTPTDVPVTEWPSEVVESRAAIDAMVAYRLKSSSRKRTLFQKVQKVSHSFAQRVANRLASS